MTDELSFSNFLYLSFKLLVLSVEHPYAHKDELNKTLVNKIIKYKSWSFISFMSPLY